MATAQRKKKEAAAPVGTGLMALSERDYAKVIRTMKHPPKPNAAMRRAFEAYKQMCVEDYQRILKLAERQ